MKKEVCLNAVHAVFNDDWSVKPCGRETCMELIRVLSENAGCCPDAFGRLDTGMLDIPAIRAYIESL